MAKIACSQRSGAGEKETNNTNPGLNRLSIIMTCSVLFYYFNTQQLAAGFPIRRVGFSGGKLEVSLGEFLKENQGIIVFQRILVSLYKLPIHIIQGDAYMRKLI